MYLSTAAAGPAGLWLSTRLSPATLTEFAVVLPLIFQRSLNACSHLIETQLNTGFQVVASLRTSSAAAEDRPAEDIVEHAEDVFEAHVREVMHTDPLQTLVSETIVSAAFFRIAEDLIGFGAFLKLLASLGIIPIAIGVILHSHASIGQFDLFGGGFSAHSQHIVVIPLLRHNNSTLAKDNGGSRFTGLTDPPLAPIDLVFNSRLRGRLLHPPLVP